MFLLEWAQPLRVFKHCVDKLPLMFGLFWIIIAPALGISRPKDIMLQYNLSILAYGKLYKIKLQFTQEPCNSHFECITRIRTRIWSLFCFVAKWVIMTLFGIRVRPKYVKIACSFVVNWMHILKYQGLRVQMSIKLAYRASIIEIYVAKMRKCWKVVQFHGPIRAPPTLD